MLRGLRKIIETALTYDMEGFDPSDFKFKLMLRFVFSIAVKNVSGHQNNTLCIYIQEVFRLDTKKDAGILRVLGYFLQLALIEESVSAAKK